MLAMFLQISSQFWIFYLVKDLVWTSPLTLGVTVEDVSSFTVVVDDKMVEMHSKFSGNTQSEVIPKHVSRR